MAAYREDGLTDFFNRAERWVEEPETLTTETTDSNEAWGEQTFRLRREQLVLTSDLRNYYSSLSVDTESRWFMPLHTSGLLKKGRRDSVEAAARYWEEHWGKQIDAAFHIAFENVTGVFDPRVVPQTEYRPIWKFFNPGEGLIGAYSNKLLFSRLVPTNNQPTTRLVCIDGRFYDSDATWLLESEDIESIMTDMRTGVIKPTDTDNGVDEHGHVTTRHPTSGVEYNRLEKVPNYDVVIQFAESLHAQTPYFDLLSWDVAVDPDGQPVLIECNFRGAVWLYQIATGQPLFGDFTEDVLDAVRRHREV